MIALFFIDSVTTNHVNNEKKVPANCNIKLNYWITLFAYWFTVFKVINLIVGMLSVNYFCLFNSG